MLKPQTSMALLIATGLVLTTGVNAKTVKHVTTKTVTTTKTIPAISEATDTTAPDTGWHIDNSHTFIGFTVNHMGFSTVHGQFKKFSSNVDFDGKNLAKLKLEVNIDTGSLDTNWKARDEHLAKAEFFNVEQYPTMTFTTDSVKVNDKTHAQILGQLTLLGQTKPVTLKLTLTKRGISPMTKHEVIGFNATTTIKRSEFGMTAYVPAVSDDISVVIDGEITQGGEPAAPAPVAEITSP